MIKESNGHHLEEGIELVKSTAANEPHEDHNLNSLVERMVSQCSALLRQQLERKVVQEPSLYDQNRIDRIMREFEASSTDIEAVITDRVKLKVTNHVQEEILRLLDDTLSDVAESLGDPMSDNGARGIPPSFIEGARHQFSERRGSLESGTLGNGPAGTNETAVEVSTESPPEPAASTAFPLHNGTPEATYPVNEDVLSSKAADSDPEMSSDPEGPSQVSSEGMFEGTVKLELDATDSVHQVIEFVDALRSKSDLRLLQLVGSHDKGVGIWLGLRVPLLLKDVLLDMECVSEVDSQSSQRKNGDDPMLNVRLRRAESQPAI